MLTPDIQIDRRIILEAKSLMAQGKDIIIIAGNDGSMCEYETMDGIKIRRPLYSGVDGRLLWIYRIWSWIKPGITGVWHALIRRLSW